MTGLLSRIPRQGRKAAYVILLAVGLAWVIAATIAPEGTEAVISRLQDAIGGIVGTLTALLALANLTPEQQDGGESECQPSGSMTSN